METSPKLSRRKMVKRSILGAIGLGVLYSSWEVFSIYKTPDLSEINNHAKLIDALTETIIPRTETPGASDVEAYRFVIYSLKTNVSKKSQNSFLEGLSEVREESTSKYKKNFEDCTADERAAILLPISMDGNRFSGLPGKIQNKIYYHFLTDAYINQNLFLQVHEKQNLDLEEAHSWCIL